MARALAVLGLTVSVAAAAPRAATAQMGGDPELHRDALRRLAFLAGQWEGDGWFVTREGRRDIRQYEDVRYELDGTILLIEGTARERTGAEVGAVIFNAFAVVSWSQEGGYRMHSYLWNGLQGERELTVGAQGFSWQQQTPGGPVEYVMNVTPEGDWHEVGTLTRGGQEVRIIEFLVGRQ